MCSIQDQFSGFLATNQLKVGGIVGVKDLNWNPRLDASHPILLTEEMTDIMLVGRKAERFFSMYITSIDPRKKMLVENVQIVENGITLGELDAIVQEGKRVVHLELVYKFYLFDPTIVGEEIEKWIGPNRKDHLHSKLEKLKLKQFPLLLNPATKGYIENEGLKIEELEQELLFLANCFVPWGFLNKTQFLSDGYWLTREHVQGEEFTQQQFFIPSKHHWMIRECEDVSWLSHSAFLEELETHLSINRSPLVWIKNKDHSFNRVFVVWW